MTNASATPPAAPAETPPPQASGRNAAVGLLGFAVAFLTPTLVMYATAYASHSGLAGSLAFVLTAGLMALFLLPKSPLGIKGRALGVIARAVLDAGVVALLVATGLPVWAVIFAVLATLVLVLARGTGATAAK